ncbi:MAG: hypothetical protein ABII20_03855 [Candidatus Omnitrophota bacterium]|nr:hypothetical protein [Candidatus Omnitrophota bacterium]MBU2527842.1 hypothetical protein [bacterium]MBU3930757.1 hypothetical protein [bacterium]MBU4123309.1 hypothetical protein [bacterium]
MKKQVANQVTLFLVSSALLINASGAGAESLISGFADILYRDGQSENSSFQMGAFEIDFETAISDQVSFEGAVVVEDGEAALGQTLVDFSIIKEKLGLQAGLIDIPFGIDCHTFAACDRKLISPPITTELMMDGGWGDTGINLHGETSILNYNLFAVNGMGVDTSSAPVNQTADNNNSKTYGGRIGVSPAKQLELGFSFAQGPYLDDDSKKLWQRTGADVRFYAGGLELKGEYLSGKEDLPATGENKHSGFYVQALMKIYEKTYGALRLGEWKSDGGSKIERTTITVGYDMTESVSIRGEYLITGETPSVNNNSVALQTVISF